MRSGKRAGGIDGRSRLTTSRRIGGYLPSAGVFLRELARQGRSGAATASPATVAILTAKLRRLIERWPSLPVDVKTQLAAAKDSHATGTDYLKEKRP
jgi:hypothetical protein